MWLESIADYLVGKGVSGAGDKDVFVQHIPADVPQAVSLMAPPNGIPIDKELRGFHKGTFQVVVRARTSVVAEQLCQRVSDALATDLVTTLGDGVVINYIHPRHLPAAFPRSNGDFYEASVNFDICFLRLSA